MKHIPAVLAIGILGLVSTAQGYDQQVSSELSVEGYSVYAGEGMVQSRRRVVENLQLGAWHILPGEKDPYYKGPRLAISGAFRVFGDMGIGRAETSPSSDASYVPGLVAMDFDALTAFVEMTGLLKNVMDLRAGRQIRLDTVGFIAFDGAECRMRLPIGLELDTYVGLEVRGGNVMGYDELELDGTDRGGRREMEETSYPDRQEPAPRLAVGSELLILPWRWMEVAAAFRVVGISSEESDIADERVGGRLTLNFDHVHADARTVFSPLVNTFSEVDAEMGVTPLDLVTVYAEYHRYEPVFEGDSIFNVFDMSPQNDLGGRMALRPHRHLELATWGFARLVSDSAGIQGDATNDIVSGAGGGIGGNYRTRLRGLSLRLNYLKEWGEARIGAELGGGHGFMKEQRLWLSFRLSYWHIEDDFSEYFSGDSAGYVLSARFKIAHRTYCLAEFEHYVGDGRDKRFYALALIRMDLWR